MMEKQTEKKNYLHYNHTDSCNSARWNARECHEFMYSSRPWQNVVDFYSNVVNGKVSLSSSILFQNEDTKTCINEVVEETKRRTTGRWERVTFKILLSYHETSFNGWKKQPGLNTVQGIVERFLGRFVDDKKAEKLKDKCLPLEGCTTVEGRTDKGVTALKQACSFWVHQPSALPTMFKQLKPHYPVTIRYLGKVEKESRSCTRVWSLLATASCTGWPECLCQHR